MENRNPSDFFYNIGGFFISFLNEVRKSLLEIASSIWKGQIPEIRLSLATIFICITFYFHLDVKILSYLHHPQLIVTGRWRVFLSSLLGFCPWILWGFYRNKIKRRLNEKLQFVFQSMRATSGLGLSPSFVFDLPIDTQTRKLRLWANGLALTCLKENKSKIEDGLGFNISKIGWADDNRKMLDVVYCYGSLPDFYVPEKLYEYKNFEFPIGKTINGELTTGLKKIPHFLIAGETGTGKSSYIRLVTEVLLMNNQDIEIYFLDFKSGVEASAVVEDPRVHIISTPEEGMKVITEINSILDARGKEIAGIARDIDAFNQKQKNPEKKFKRLLVVVDEISEISPKFKSPNKNEMTLISNGINRIARLGRALGIHLIIGTQKPDAKNLDPTIKANLPGILCFPVSHPTQSMVVLGDGRAADLNAEIKGRAIWKHGSFSMEVQTPFMEEKEIEEAKKLVSQYWGNKGQKTKEQATENASTKKTGKELLLKNSNLDDIEED